MRIDQKRSIQLFVYETLDRIERGIELLMKEVRRRMNEGKVGGEEEIEEENRFPISQIFDIFAFYKTEERRLKDVMSNFFVLINQISQKHDMKEENFRREEMVRNLRNLFGGTVDLREFRVFSVTESLVGEIGGLFRDAFPFIELFFKKGLEEEFRKVLCLESKKGSLEPPLLDIKVFPREERDEEPFYVRETSHTCAGFSGSLVVLDRFISEKEVVLVGMISHYDVFMKECCVVHRIVWFGSKEFHNFWEKAKSLRRGSKE